MATILSAIGRFAFRRRGLVTLLWLLALAGAGIAAWAAPPVPAGTLMMPGTESQQAYDLLERRFPGAHADDAHARVVVRAPAGRKLSGAAQRREVRALVRDLARLPQVAAVTDPFLSEAISKDRTTAYLDVTYTVAAAEVSDAAHAAFARELDEARGTGLTAEAAGDAVPAGGTRTGSSPAGPSPARTPPDGSSADGPSLVDPSPAGPSSPEPVNVTVYLGLAVSALVLLLAFGSPVAAGLPLLAASVSAAAGVLGAVALGSTFGLSTTTAPLALTAGPAACVAHTLLVVSRYRAGLADHARRSGDDAAARTAGEADRTREDAAGRAVAAAGPAVLLAGLTSAVALAALAVLGVAPLTVMGLAAAGSVTFAMLIALTLVPALLGWAPVTVLSRFDRAIHRAHHTGTALPARLRRKAAGRAARQDRPNLAARWAALVTRWPLPVLLLALAGLGTLALPAASLHLGLPGDGQLPHGTTQRKAYDMLSDAFGPGYNGPLTVTVERQHAMSATATVYDRLAALEAPGSGKAVSFVSRANANHAGNVTILTVMPATAPTAPKTEQLIERIRADLGGQSDRADGAIVLVTGPTAASADFTAAFRHALLPCLALLAATAFLLLTLFFPSVLVPLKAALGFLLSVAAALGAVVAVFQWGWFGTAFDVHRTGPVPSTVPLVTAGVAFVLATGHEVFLLARIRQAYADGEDVRASVVTGLRHSGRVVTAGALATAAVFAGLVLDDDGFVKTLGFGLATAVLLDTFIVRMTIVPALFALLGDRAWWTPYADADETRTVLPGAPKPPPRTGPTPTLSP